MDTLLQNLLSSSPQVTQVKTDVTASIDELKLAIKAQLAMQAISTAGVLFLCYLAWDQAGRRSNRL